MAESSAERSVSKRRFEPGKTYNNPFEPPGTPPKGYDWMAVSRHVVEGYGESWRLIPKQPAVGTTHAAESARAIEEAEEKLEDYKSSGDPRPAFPTPEQIEESRSRYFPNAEDDLPDGDRD